MMRLPLDRILFCVVAVAVSEPDLSATEAGNGRKAEAGYLREFGKGSLFPKLANGTVLFI